MLPLGLVEVSATLRPMADSASYRPRALVTGASSGIGAALARELAARGHPVVLVARRRNALEQLAASLPTPADVMVADLSTPLGLSEVEQLLMSTEDPVLLLVNNAATGVFAPLADQDQASLDATVQVNVLAPMRLSRAALPRMAAAGGGGIIMISSSASGGAVGLTPYCASKAFLDTLGRTLAEEVASSGVLVTTAAPGYTRTAFHDRLGQDVSDVSEGWWATSEEVARATLDAHTNGRRRVELHRRSLLRRARGKAYRATRGLVRR